MNFKNIKIFSALHGVGGWYFGKGRWEMIPLSSLLQLQAQECPCCHKSNTSRSSPSVSEQTFPSFSRWKQSQRFPEPSIPPRGLPEEHFLYLLGEKSPKVTLFCPNQELLLPAAVNKPLIKHHPLNQSFWEMSPCGSLIGFSSAEDGINFFFSAGFC